MLENKLAHDVSMSGSLKLEVLGVSEREVSALVGSKYDPFMVVLVVADVLCCTASEELLRGVLRVLSSLGGQWDGSRNV